MNAAHPQQHHPREEDSWEMSRNVFYTREYKVVCTHMRDCPYPHLPPTQSLQCKMHPNPHLDNMMRWNDEKDHLENGEFVIGSAIISEQTRNDKDFQIPRKDYMNALLTGDAALMKHLNINGEFDTLYINDSSSSDTEDKNITPNNCAVNLNPPKPTLPLFPMIQLKRRRVMYYVPIKFDDVEVDALVDTGACLSAIPLNVYNKILELASSNILFCKEKPVFKIQAANGETSPVLYSAIISFQINGFTENYHFQEEFLILKR